MNDLLFTLGQVAGVVLVFGILIGIGSMARWLFRKVFPAKPRKISGPLSGAGKIQR